MEEDEEGEEFFFCYVLFLTESRVFVECLGICTWTWIEDDEW